MIEVRLAPTFDAWRRAARRLLHDGVPPEQIAWIEDASASPSGGLVTVDDTADAAIKVPKTFVDLSRRVAARRDPDRWALLYRLLWRVVREKHDLLSDAEDADVVRARTLERSPIEIPADRTLSAVQQAAAQCTACPLYEHATQTVFGVGPREARVMFIGEQPGDQEDLAGKPFVGPAGDVLNRALADVGISRDNVYVTNVVKHFKWVPRGKRRLHQTPQLPEIQACRPWLEAEIDMVKPAMIVCLGATAAQTFMGPQFRVTRSRGQVFHTRWAPWLMATVHPSSILRVDEPAAQQQAYADFVADLRKVKLQFEAEENPTKSSRFR